MSVGGDRFFLFFFFFFLGGGMGVTKTVKYTICICMFFFIDNSYICFEYGDHKLKEILGNSLTFEYGMN